MFKCFYNVSLGTDDNLFEWDLYNAKDAMENLTPPNATQELMIENGVNFAVLEKLDLHGEWSKDKNCYKDDPHNLVVSISGAIQPYI